MTINTDSISANTLLQQVYQRLKSAILEQRIKPGERVVAQKFAQRWGVSLTPIRESLRLLEKDGLILFRPHRGATAALPTREDFEELYRVRAALEQLATAEACPKITAQDFDRLTHTQDIGRDCLAGKRDPKDWIDADDQFHNIIINCSGNHLLQTMLASLRDRIGLHRQAYFTHNKRIAASCIEHDAIITALRSKDAEHASACMAEHLRNYIDVASQT